MSTSHGTSEEEEEIAPDNQMIQALINMKNLILIRMRSNANNLFTFAKATPLVNLRSKKDPLPVSDATRSDFNMRDRMLQELEDTGKQFKVKFDIFSNKFIKDIAKNGSRLLHLTSDIPDPNKLNCEGRFGICNEFPIKSLEKTIKGIAPFGLPVDVVGLGLPNSVKIGRVFMN